MKKGSRAASPTMKSHRQPLLWLGLASTAVLAALVLLLATRPAGLGPVRLPTGERVSICGVTYGTNHLAPPWPPWMRLLPRSVEPWVRQRARSLPLSRDITTGRPEVVLSV